MIKKFLIIFSFVILAIAPNYVSAADDSAQNKLPSEIFSAQVVKILREEAVIDPDTGASSMQQNLELRALDGKNKNKNIEIEGIGEPLSATKNVYKVGDQVSIEASADDQGGIKYYITDYIRTNSLKWLAIVFVISLLIVGRWKGLRSLIALAATFFVIMKYMLPQIMDGSDPVVVTIIGSLAILLIIVYVTEGFNAKAHISVGSIFLSLLVTIGMSSFFVELARLSGLANEEASFLIGYGGQIVNFKGLLLAGIIVGALGVLDDVVTSQITAVEEIHKASSGLTKMEIFRKAMNIGVSHISAMTNTLFLAYAGASLPLLILFLSGQSAFASPLEALNNESLATEVIRTLTGSIGLIIAMPISTILAAWWAKKN